MIMRWKFNHKIYKVSIWPCWYVIYTCWHYCWENSRNFNVDLKKDDAVITLLGEVSNVTGYNEINGEAKVLQVGEPVLIPNSKMVQNAN